MANYNRAKLSPRYTQSLEKFGDSKNKSKVEEQPPVEQPPVEQPPVEQPPVEQGADETDEDDWLSSLTTYVPPQDEQGAGQEQPPQDEQGADETDEEYIARLREQFKSLEYVDEDAVTEIFDKIFTPLLKHQSERSNAEIKALRDELSNIKQHTASLTDTQRQAYYDKLNQPILERHPQAQKIMRSTEFREFVNAKSNKYSTESALDILNNAYLAGDTEYVVAVIDEFVASRKKPKPPVNADGKSTSAPSTPKNGKKMTEAEFLTKRKEIMRNPKKFPKGALRDLELTFFNQ